MGIRWGGVTESRHRARGQEQSMSVGQGEQSRGARKCGTERVRLGVENMGATGENMGGGGGHNEFKGGKYLISSFLPITSLNNGTFQGSTLKNHFLLIFTYNQSTQWYFPRFKSETKVPVEGERV